MRDRAIAPQKPRPPASRPAASDAGAAPLSPHEAQAATAQRPATLAHLPASASGDVLADQLARVVDQRAQRDADAEATTIAPSATAAGVAAAAPLLQRVRTKTVKKQRRKSEKARLWAQRISQELGLYTEAELLPLCEGLVDQPLSVQQAQTIAPLLGAGWPAEEAASLGRRFVANPGGRPLAEWVYIATKVTPPPHGPPVPRPEVVATFARLAPPWTTRSCGGLAAAYTSDRGGLDTREWVGLASIGGRLANSPHDVAHFARIAGWSAAGKLALAGLYAAAPAIRSAGDWSRLAASHPALVDAHATVAAFAAIQGNWTTPGLVRLAALFAADAGGRTVADWAQLAVAHAMFADAELPVAQLARENWTGADVGLFATAGLLETAPALALIGLLTTGVTARHLRAMQTAGWTPADIGTFAGRLLAEGVLAASIETSLATPNMIAATVNMHGPWTAGELARFMAGAIRRATPANTLADLMRHVGFPAAARPLISLPHWPADRVGEFCTRAAVALATPTMITQLLNTGTARARLRAMTAEAWPHDELGTFIGKILAGTVTPANLEALLAQVPFARGSRRMHTATWTLQENADFVIGALLDTAVSKDRLAGLVDDAAFGTASHTWLAPGWTAREVGTIAAQARHKGLAAAKIRTFMNTGNAAKSAFDLPRGSWSALQVGWTFGHCLSRPAGAPSDGQMESLLDLAATPIAGSQILPPWVRAAADGATCGRPNWDEVIAHVPTFQANYVGPRGQAARAARSWDMGGNGSGDDWWVTLTVPGERVKHVEQGHTWEYHLFSFVNCTRPGVDYGGHASFFAPGYDVPNLLDQVRDGARQLAMNAAANAAYGNSYPTQATILTCRTGVLPSGTPVWTTANGGYYRSSTFLSQCYPTVGTQIVGRDLVGMGRYFGLIP